MARAMQHEGEAIQERNPLKRWGTPEDAAGVAIFPAPRASATLTCAVIPCDGGSGDVKGHAAAGIERAGVPAPPPRR